MNRQLNRPLLAWNRPLLVWLQSIPVGQMQSLLCSSWPSTLNASLQRPVCRSIELFLPLQCACWLDGCFYRMDRSSRVGLSIRMGGIGIAMGMQVPVGEQK